ncbi:MAG: desulfoferrodoxin family protein [Eubacteriales bacterium]
MKVSVGSTLHPMEEKHYIEWIEIIAGGKVYRKFLQPGNIPEAEFFCEADNVAARAYRNIHSFWKGQNTGSVRLETKRIQYYFTKGIFKKRSI